MSQNDLLFAFIEHSQHGQDHIAFSKRGASSRGYVNVFGPSHDPRDPKTARIVIDHDGSVAFKDASVAQALGAQPRPEGVMAPSTGAARWELSATTIAATYGGNAHKLVGAIVAAMRANATW
ncbi:hypothetical protein [Sorangium sp. So ce693]|uniref:hypothetical protein n=1 Tax=Sorangium sp. So ce693 TaxID=3133318 RepID=UPI003F6108BE